MILALVLSSLLRSMLFLKLVLVEERGPIVTRCAVPRESERWAKGAASPKSERRIPSAPRLVDKANTCSLSFDLGVPGRMERYREAGQPLLAA
jgi:hypothetical protein